MCGIRNADWRPHRRPPRITAPRAWPGWRDLDAQDDSPYSAHDQPVVLKSPTAQQRRGEALYLKNCAFCHAADGTARHWIGRFLEPHPRDLTEAAFRAGFDQDRLVQRIEEGLPGTAMPTWRNILKRDEIRAIAVYMEAAFGPLGSVR